MTDTSPRIGLAYILPSQAQKHVTVNESLRRLDAVVQCAVQSATLSAEPASPQEGDAYILPAASTGSAWSAMTPGRIAVFQDGVFMAIAPSAGFLAYVRDSGRFMLFDGANWAAIPLSASNVPVFGINTAGDTVNRLAVKADAELLSHDDVTPGSGDARKIVNKATAAHTASLMLQSGFSTRAEIGLLGNDDLSMKVSTNGSSFTEVIRVEAATGNIALKRAGAARSIHAGGPSDPGIRLQEDGAAGYGELVNASSTQTLLSHVNASGQALIDLAPIPSDGTSSATFRFFRTTNTTHICNIDIHAGDGTSATNHRLTGKEHSYLQMIGGNLRIGSNALPVCKLDVAGPVRVAGYTVAALPPANAGAGQIIYVSNEAGGAVLAFSDGTNWRRVTDRAIVS